MSAEVVLGRDLRDRTVPALSLGLALGGLSFASLALAAQIAGTLETLAASFPEPLLALVGGDAPGGYVVGEVFSLIGPLAVVSYAVVSGAGALAGEERRGTLGLLSAQPVSRSGILAARAAGLLAALAVAVSLFVAGVLAAQAGFDLGLRGGDVVAAGVHLLALGACFGMLALAAGALTGRPEPAAALVGALALAAYVSEAMLPLAGYDRLAELSPWFYYAGSDPLRTGVDLAHLALLLALAAAAYGAGQVGFTRRDLKG